MAYGRGNANRGTTAPTAPVEIKVVVGTIATGPTGYTCKLEICVIRGGVVMALKGVRVKKGIAVINSGTTDSNGEWVYEHPEQLSEAGKTVSLQFRADGEVAEATATFTLPAVATTTGKDDPESITLTRHHDDAGIFSVFVRVLKTCGVGMATTVEIFADGIKHRKRTNNQGNCVWKFPRVIDEGESAKVTATVSGIEDPACLPLRRSHARSVGPNRFSKKWWFCTNNGRAVIFLTMMVVFWLLALIVGWGDPLFNPPQTELSTQQLLHNQLVETINPDYVVKPEVSQGNWQKNFWLFTFLWSISALIYAILSLREEVAEGLREGFERLIDRPYVKAGDPLIDRIMSWSGAQGVARKAPAKTSDGTDGATETKERISFRRLFETSLLSDIIVEVIPKVFARIFR